ncbi:MAG: exodeoxyribonuclease VII large subunit [Candidatus Cyclobacteriaceae bacterium M2_1C_046]
MSQAINDKKVFSLLEVTTSIRKTLEARYTSAFWVKAEMNKLNFYKHSGHCYPDLVEKKDGKVVAQLRSILWKGDYTRINEAFERVLKEPLKDGIKILLYAKIGFTPEYGLSLQILDIDPAFTLGDLEQEKLQTIMQLQENGLFSKNKSLPIPLLPQRIAIISVDTSKGYADFQKVLEAAQASWNYRFFYMLFPSLLQGDKAALAIMQQLRNIRRVIHHFDIVAIIRGGGGDVGLSCYNNYALAKEIAAFPLPVITGIGHSTNETVAEMIACENAITPTKLSEFLIQKFHDFRNPVENAQKIIIDKGRRIIQEQNAEFAGQVKLLKSVTKNVIFTNEKAITRQADNLIHQMRFGIAGEKERLSSAGEKIKRAAYDFCANEKNTLIQFSLDLKKDSSTYLKYEKVELANLEKHLQLLSPTNVMKRGYSITKVNGKALSSTEGLKEGDELNTILYDGNLISAIKKIIKK